ncbi:UDP-2,4-diacetamido-2,4,6-trideoxy-beta-L-altropyranose hydrolase [Flavobacterium tructae]|uniref:UDP-2,4-diacetamido-2,4, 6-trideoxy-beta-L-altropyranose hydrolase n=1 Tax=Flavobacterium tructae TaxID=1114873 RepID=UPI002551E313|nr:UDP-2,4-diacetamido-2,4,6-trideoxy-beta-L-altropyranose hydrolase [Flavobacterium tructae]MDL2143313.1 UDP-2,4-diacetamido-2,4,6-trideoxy-beta-L-altropyranose hydrolase [Flavobacterium tructae]
MISTKDRILFRADGNHIIGLGHITRCMALADMLDNNFEIVFLCRKLTNEQKIIVSKSFSLIELNGDNLQDEIIELENIINKDDIVVLDGYCFDLSYQTKVKTMAKKLVMIDDLAERKIIADLIINHGGEFIKDKYDLESNSELLAGFKYLLVRKEFLKSRFEIKEISKIDTVFICMGGSDPFNVTPKALQATLDCNFVKKIIVVAGNAFMNFDEIHAIASLNKHVEIKIERNVDAKAMVKLINESQIAICPSSSIALEVCCVGSGILTGYVIDNQFSIHEQIMNNKCGISVGDFNTSSIADITYLLCKLNDLKVIRMLVANQKKALGDCNSNFLLHKFKEISYGA